MNIVLWIFQGVLALMMLLPGLLKISNTKGLKVKGNGNMDWVDDVSSSNVKLIGVIEILIGLGLILPMLVGIAEWLTPLAAVGAVGTMIGAMMLHIKRKDGAKAIITNLVIMAIALIYLTRGLCFNSIDRIDFVIDFTVSHYEV
ncbi:MAG: DoxX family protein [Chitinophagales bacterium]